MRISDWSSDVCSSDLDRCQLHADPHFAGAARPRGCRRRRVRWSDHRTDREWRCACWSPAIALGPLSEEPGRSHPDPVRSEEHTSELQSLMRISYAVFCLKKKNK